MKIVNVFALAALAVLIVFAAINGAMFTSSVIVSLGFARVRAPLGLILLGLAALLALVFAAYLLKVQLSALTASRGHAVELRRQRELAETAELSRYTELQRYLERQFESLLQEQQRLEQRLREELVNTNNSLAAHIGEIDDRLDRQWPVPASQQP